MDDENNNSPNLPHSKSLGLRIQKKVASKMSNKNVAKIFIDDVTGRLLDNLYSLIRLYTGNKKQADALLNDIIKIIVKIGILFRNDQLTQEELNLCNQFRQTFHLFIKSALTFYEIEYSIDKEYLSNLLKTCQSTILKVINNHLTDKSKGRINNVFDFFSEKKFLEDIFKSTYSTNNKNMTPETVSKCKMLMKDIVDDVKKLVDEGSL
jgi:hypothetical protein